MNALKSAHASLSCVLLVITGGQQISLLENTFIPSQLNPVFSRSQAMGCEQCSEFTSFTGSRWNRETIAGPVLYRALGYC